MRSASFVATLFVVGLLACLTGTASAQDQTQEVLVAKKDWERWGKPLKKLSVGTVVPCPVLVYRDPPRVDGTFDFPRCRLWQEAYVLP